jgi:hypothetical protein
MLYDPKWEGASLLGFIGWLETKDPKARYNFNDCNGLCLLGQYMTAIGIAWTGAPEHWNRSWDKSSYMRVAQRLFGPTRYKEPAFWVLSKRPHTFGAALKRAREFALSNGDRDAP